MIASSAETALEMAFTQAKTVARFSAAYGDREYPGIVTCPKAE
jgi:hypothetical protein